MSLLRYYLRRFAVSPWALFPALLAGLTTFIIYGSTQGPFPGSYGGATYWYRFVLVAKGLEGVSSGFLVFSGALLGLSAMLMLKSRVSEITLITRHSRDRIFFAATAAPLLIMFALWTLVFSYAFFRFGANVGYLRLSTYLTFIGIRTLEMMVIYYLVLAVALNFSPAFAFFVVVYIVGVLKLNSIMSGFHLGAFETYFSRLPLVVLPEIGRGFILLSLQDAPAGKYTGFQPGLPLDTVSMFICYCLWLGFAVLASLFGFRRYREVGRANSFDQSGF